MLYSRRWCGSVTREILFERPLIAIISISVSISSVCMTSLFYNIQFNSVIHSPVESLDWLWLYVHGCFLVVNVACGVNLWPYIVYYVTYSLSVSGSVFSVLFTDHLSFHYWICHCLLCAMWCLCIIFMWLSLWSVWTYQLCSAVLSMVASSVWPSSIVSLFFWRCAHSVLLSRRGSMAGHLWSSWIND
jgi:hypothetical protein